MPACLPLVSFLGDERATEMQFEREAFTKVIIFNGGIEISQDEEACPHCDRIGGISVLFSASRAREVIKARFADRLGDWAMREIRLIDRLQPPMNCVGSVAKRGGAA